LGLSEIVSKHIYEESVLVIPLADFMALVREVFEKEKSYHFLIERIEDKASNFTREKGVEPRKKVIKEQLNGGIYEKIVRYYIPEGYFPFSRIYECNLWEEVFDHTLNRG